MDDWSPNPRCFLPIPRLPNPREHLRAVGPGFPLFGHGFYALGVSFGEVFGFGAVGFHVVEFPGAGGSFGDEFPLAVAD